jgi:hypothetical protein
MASKNYKIVMIFSDRPQGCPRKGRANGNGRLGLSSRFRASACERGRPFQSLRGTIDEETLDTWREYVHL